MPQIQARLSCLASGLPVHRMDVVEKCKGAKRLDENRDDSWHKGTFVDTRVANQRYVVKPCIRANGRRLWRDTSAD